MKEDLDKIEMVITNLGEDTSKINDLLSVFFKKHLKKSQIENYIGDYPTFIEPVHLGKKVMIGDDVLLGPNVYIGSNVIIGDYVELSNTIVFDNVLLGENFKLENCIVVRESVFEFKNLIANNCILKGKADSKDKLNIISF